jgi:hypothetical protein
VSELNLLYGQVPTVDACTGECWKSCGPIGTFDAETRRISEAYGRTPGVREDGMCSELNVFGRCSIYNDRPLVCRLWGASDPMPCPFCAGPPRPLSAAAAHRLMQQARAL